MGKIPAINQIIKKKRMEMNLTQSKLSQLIFKSLPTIKRYEGGETIPEATLVKFCEVLKLDLFFLLEMQISQNELILKRDSTDKIFYNDLISKYSPQIKKYQDEIYNKEENLEYCAERLLDIYKLFYDKYYNHIGPIAIDGKKRVLKHKITDDRIVIFMEATPFLLTKNNKNTEIEEINTFTIGEALEFIEEIKNYFNFRSDILKKRKSSTFSLGELFWK